MTWSFSSLIILPWAASETSSLKVNSDEEISSLTIYSSFDLQSHQIQLVGSEGPTLGPFWLEPNRRDGLILVLFYIILIPFWFMQFYPTCHNY